MSGRCCLRAFAARLIVVGFCAAGAFAFPAGAADNGSGNPGLLGQWGRDMLFFEPPASGPGPVVRAERKADGDNPDDKIEIDRSRARFLLDPPASWRQAYAEAGRIMRHDFWVPDMADVDWDTV